MQTLFAPKRFSPLSAPKNSMGPLPNLSKKCRRLRRPKNRTTIQKALFCLRKMKGNQNLIWEEHNASCRPELSGFFRLDYPDCLNRFSIMFYQNMHRSPNQNQISFTKTVGVQSNRLFFKELFRVLHVLHQQFRNLALPGASRWQ